jgi:hypothetical protein
MLSPEHRRLLNLLARHPHGCTEAILMAHGFKVEQLSRLVVEKLATAEPVRDGDLPIVIVRGGDALEPLCGHGTG